MAGHPPVVVDPRKDKKTVTVHSAPSEGPTAGRWTLDTSSLKSYPADW
ncbi:hypothetical protein ACIPYQ_04850 [Streptomyces sp. NPDC090045]